MQKAPAGCIFELEGMCAFVFVLAEQSHFKKSVMLLPAYVEHSRKCR